MPRRLVLPLLLVLTACAAPPLDPEGTLDRVTGGTIRAGITDNPPWAIVDEPPSGVEVELVEGLAADLDADVEWVDGSEEELFGALELGQLDVVVGGLSAENPFSMHAALTHPYFTSRIIVVGPRFSDVKDITGVRVAVEANTEAAGLLEKTDAVVDLVDDIEQVGQGFIATEDWLADDWMVTDTGVVLKETDHVMAVRLGENGWMVTLERYLLSRAGDIPRLLDEAES